MLTRRDVTPRFEELTETTGVPLSTEGASMMYTRYAVAADLVAGKRVLELGCGSGQGFGLLAARAARMIGGDFSLALLRQGRAHYGDRMGLVRLSADALPFRNAAFDVVLCFEASYYVPDMSRAFRDIARVLTPDGTVMFVNANPERPDFIRSPHSVRYHSADEFRRALTALGFHATVEGAFPIDPPDPGAFARIRRLSVVALRRALEGLRLVPRTLRGRARLKRLVYGQMLEVPEELPPGFAPVADRVPVPPGPVRDLKVIYVTGIRGV